MNIDLNFVDKYSKDLFNYNQHDVNIGYIKWRQVEQMKQGVAQILYDLDDANDVGKINTICNKVLSTIYKACQNNYKPIENESLITMNTNHCTSVNYKAIAEIIYIPIII